MFISFSQRYDMIGKMETMAEDIEYIVNKFPYLKKFMDVEQKFNTAEKNSRKVIDDEEVQTFMSQLSPKQKLSICDIYRWDMKMFNYTCIY